MYGLTISLKEHRNVILTEFRYITNQGSLIIASDYIKCLQMAYNRILQVDHAESMLVENYIIALAPYQGLDLFVEIFFLFTFYYYLYTYFILSFTDFNYFTYIFNRWQTLYQVFSILYCTKISFLDTHSKVSCYLYILF